MAAAVSVVVPFYNEVDNVAPLRNQIEDAFKDREAPDYECVFVDDGSTDGTGAAIRRLALDDSRIQPVYLAENRGQSAALMAGMRAARGNVLITLDGDLQNDPADIPRVLELLADYDCVCGVRVNRRDTWVRRASSRIANKVRNAVLHDGISDTGCGLKGFRKECVDALVCFNGVHRFFPVLIRHAGFSIVECPANHREREHGVSKYGVNNRLWRGLFDLVGVAWLRRRLVHYRVASDPAHADAATDPPRDGAVNAASVGQEH